MTGQYSRRTLLRLGAAGVVATLDTVAGLGSSAASDSTARAAAPPPVLKVGLALASPLAEVGWTKQHTLGLAAIKEALGEAVVTTVVDNVAEPQAAERIFRSLAVSGHRLIYGSSFSHGPPAVRVAALFPQVAFDSCAGTRVLANLGAFEARYHEGTYLAGIAAAQVSKTGRLGFIGGFAIPDVVGPANAFLLGAQSVRPAATCNVIFMNSWSDPGKEKQTVLLLAAQGCDVVAAMTDSPVAAQAAESAGVWAVGYASDMRKFAPTRQLTAFTLDWRSIYVQDARDVLAGTWRAQSRWEGLKEGVVRMSPYAAALNGAARALLAGREDAIKAGSLQPFGGEIRDQSGRVRVAAGAVLSEREVRSIDWMVAGMSGRASG